MLIENTIEGFYESVKKQENFWSIIKREWMKSKVLSKSVWNKYQK